jgi:hypothetical protein
LDGTTAGITAAQAAVTGTESVMKWDIGTHTVSSPTILFAKGQVGSTDRVDATTWTADPVGSTGSAQDFRFVQVYASVNVPLTFMQAIKRILANDTATTAPVNAVSVGGQIMITGYSAGLLPFSPIAPSPNAPDNFGFTPGTIYTIRYPSNGGQSKDNVCAGDQNQSYWSSLPSQDRGYWGSTSASTLRGEIIDDTQLVPITIGQEVPMVGGNKNTEGNALASRVAEDSNTTSTTYSDYVASGTGNGRRVVGVPINSGPTVVSPYTDPFTAVGIGAFFLMTADNYSSVTGSDPICAIYIGPYVQGKPAAGAGQSSNSGSTGGYMVRLVQ